MTTDTEQLAKLAEKALSLAEIANAQIPSANFNLAWFAQNHVAELAQGFLDMKKERELETTWDWRPRTTGHYWRVFKRCNGTLSDPLPYEVTQSLLESYDWEENARRDEPEKFKNSQEQIEWFRKMPLVIEMPTTTTLP